MLHLSVYDFLNLIGQIFFSTALTGCQSKVMLGIISIATADPQRLEQRTLQINRFEKLEHADGLRKGTFILLTSLQCHNSWFFL